MSKFYVIKTSADEPETGFQKTVDLEEAKTICPFLKLQNILEREDFSLLILAFETEKYQIVRLS